MHTTWFRWAWPVLLVWLAVPSTRAREELFAFGSIPDQTATSFAAFQLAVPWEVVDEICFAAISFSLDTAPAGMSIDGSGVLRWTPTAAQENQIFVVGVRGRGHYEPGSPCGGGTQDHTVSFPIDVVPGLQDLDGDGISDPYEDVLIDRHAPLVRLHPSDAYRPSTVSWYLSRAHLRYHHNSCSDDAILGKGSVTTTNIDAQRHRRKRTTVWPPWSYCSHEGSYRYSDERTPNSDFFLQIPNDSSEIPTRLGDHSGAWTCYAHVKPSPYSPGLFDIQYWFFYPYNGKLGGIAGAHEGDWEHVTVRVMPNGVTRSQVYYAAHDNEGWWYDPTVLLETADGRPVVYSAKDSHASYPWPGTWQRGLLPDDHTQNGGPQWDCKNATVNVGEREAPLPAGEDWLRYSGRWGELGTAFSGPFGPAFQAKWDTE